MYNIYMPLYLGDLLDHLTRTGMIVGIIMVVDNIVAITLQPWIGNFSDNIWTKWGRRMPFIMIGIPIAAVLFGILPLVSDSLILILVILEDLPS